MIMKDIGYYNDNWFVLSDWYCGCYCEVMIELMLMGESEVFYEFFGIFLIFFLL